MRHPRLFMQARPFWGILVSILFLTMTNTTPGAQEAASTDAPPVFQPNEIQHGFAEFDTLPDFSSDNVPAPYDGYSPSPNLPPLDEKPGGVFQSLDFAEGAEEDRTIRSRQIFLPVNPTTTFSPHTPSVFLVFTVHKLLTSYQIIGRLFLETVTGLDPSQWLDQDTADLATADESGFLKFFPPGGVWQPGRYRVDIYVGFMANALNKMGSMRFTVRPVPAVHSVP